MMMAIDGNGGDDNNDNGEDDESVDEYETLKKYMLPSLWQPCFNNMLDAVYRY